MTVREAIKICRHLGDSTTLESEKESAIRRVISSAIGLNQLSRTTLMEMLEYVDRNMLAAEADKGVWNGAKIKGR